MSELAGLLASSKVGFPERLSLSLSPCVGPEISGKTFVHSSLIIQGFLFIEPADIIFIPRKYVLNLVGRGRLLKIASTVERKIVLRLNIDFRLTFAGSCVTEE